MISYQFCRLLTALIPVKGVRRRLRRRLLDRLRDARLAKSMPIIRARYAEHVRRCRERRANGERLRVAFLICDASMFSGESVFLKMRADPRFDCSIVVAPRVTRGPEFLRTTLEKTVEVLKARYGEAVCALCEPDGTGPRPVDADLVFSTVLYEDQTHPDYTVERLSERALVAILYYGYGGLFVTNEQKTPFLPNVVLSWRYFVSNAATRDMCVARNGWLAENVRVVGYAKMDRLESEKERAARRPSRDRRRKILICPHHTIGEMGNGLALSTFLRHADFFLRLPEMFPDVNFVFRPHPLLFPRLAAAKGWGEARVAAYRAKMSSYPNVEFQQGGDYFVAFAESDALVHDCGSFLAEYFYTGHPQCYLLREGTETQDQMLPFGRKLLDHVQTARTDEEIVAFVRAVVQGTTAQERVCDRLDFARREVCVNHPHAAQAVLEELDVALKSGKDART